MWTTIADIALLHLAAFALWNGAGVAAAIRGAASRLLKRRVAAVAILDNSAAVAFTAAIITAAARKVVSVTPLARAFSTRSPTGISRQVRFRKPSGSGVPGIRQASLAFRLAGTLPEYFRKLSSISSGEGSSRRPSTPFSAGIRRAYRCWRYSATRLFRNTSPPLPSVMEWNSSTAMRRS